jgi:magnesium-protoporphyrin IX monomethyl ester (oxidative) cyclase
MRALLVYVPSRRGFGSVVVPFGPLAVANIISDAGHESRIYDFLFGNMDELKNLVRQYKPDIIGYSGIASSYPMAKEISQDLKAEFKGIPHLAGGPLASTYELLLQKNVVDYVVHGEAEANLPKLLSFIKGEHNLEDVGGLSYLRGGGIIRNKPEQQVSDLDSIKFPAYHMVDVERYFRSLKDMVDVYGYSVARQKGLEERVNRFISKGRDKYLEVVTSRGCTHACLFCYRHVRGVRRHSVEYAIRHIRHLVDTYDLGGVSIADELFNSDEKWVYDFCDAIKAEFKGELFYKILGARVPQINKDILKRLWDTGCIEINYGHESGSPRILKKYRKGATLEQNIKATRLANEIGFFTPIQLVIGSPSETTGTIRETLDFLRNVDAFYSSTSVNYIIPLPETPIWKYIKENNIIPDVEAYLERVARFGGMFGLGLNLTKSNDFVWKFWLAMIYRTTCMNEARAQGKYLTYIVESLYLGVLFKFLSKRADNLFRKFKGLFSSREAEQDGDEPRS